MTANAVRRHAPGTANDRQLLSRAAHWHADRGLFVFPLVPGRKTPAVEDWEHQATIDHLKIARLWRQARYNIGVAAGPSRLLVVDLDLPKHPADLPPERWHSCGAVTGAEVLDLVAADAGQLVPTATYTVATPSGGKHLYFYQPDDRELGNTAGRLGWKIDTRGHGGYVVGAGSITDQGQYLASNTTQPVALPGWVLTALGTTATARTTSMTPVPLRDISAYTLAALSGELDKVLAAGHGQRNDTLNSAAFVLGQLVGAQLLDQAIVRDELISAAGRIGLGLAEAERTITSGLTAGARQPRTRTA